MRNQKRALSRTLDTVGVHQNLGGRQGFAHPAYRAAAWMHFVMHASSSSISTEPHFKAIAFHRLSSRVALYISLRWLQSHRNISGRLINLSPDWETRGFGSLSRCRKHIFTLTGRWGLKLSADGGSMLHAITESRRLLGTVMWSMWVRHAPRSYVNEICCGNWNSATVRSCWSSKSCMIALNWENPRRWYQRAIYTFFRPI